MKNKFLLGMALLLALPLTGCNSGLKKYSFKEQLTDSEKYSLIANVTSCIDNISSMTTTGSSKTKTALTKDETKINQKVSLFSNGMKEETTTKTSNEKAEITIKDEVTTTISYFYDEGSKKAVNYSDDSKDGVSFFVNTFKEGKESEEFASYLHNNLAYELYTTLSKNNLKAYKGKNKGYALLVSSENEKHSFVQNVGKVIEVIDKQTNQTVILINKNYEVTEYITNSSHYTNKDPETNEYSKSVKLVTDVSSTTKFKYGSRKAGDFSAIVNQLNAGYLDYLNVNINTSKFELNADEKYAYAYSSSVKTTSEELKVVAPGKAHYQGTFSLSGGASRTGFSVNVTGEAIPNLNAKVEDIKAINFNVSEDIANTTKIADDAGNNHYMLDEGFSDYTIVFLEFDISYAINEKNAAIENIKTTFVSPNIA